MKCFVLNPLFLLIISFAGVNAQDFFDKVDSFFDTYVSGKEVNYSAIAANNASLNDLLKDIERMGFSGRSTEYKLAFYINAYNILAISSIVQEMPVKSPMEIDGFFSKARHLIAWETLTLDEIEKNKLLKVYNDPRIHFVLVCAAKGCPPLTNTAFTPDNVKERLTLLTRNAMDDPEFIRVDFKKKEIEISKIFDWYSADFGAGRSQILEFINKFRHHPLPMTYKAYYYEYDWSLNGY